MQLTLECFQGFESYEPGYEYEAAYPEPGWVFYCSVAVITAELQGSYRPQSFFSINPLAPNQAVSE